MSELVLLPNTAALISAFLRDQDEVADLVGDRVYTVLPNNKTFPMVRVTRVGGSAGTRFAHWLDAPSSRSMYGPPQRPQHSTSPRSAVRRSSSASPAPTTSPVSPVS